MEDILSVYQQPYDPKRPQICLDEIHKNLRSIPRGQIPMEKGKPKREDYEYERNSKCALFLAVEPLAGFRQVWVRSQRTKLDFAVILKDLVDDLYPEADKIVLVTDNLNIHHAACLYECYSPAEARRIAEKIEWHYTPVHASWLNIAEIELNVLSNQCLDRRIGDKETLVVKKGDGGYIYDQDDNRYIDYRLGFGPVILGHGNQAVCDRVSEAIKIGNAFAMTHEYEIEAAEKIKKMTGVDLVRFANSGTEATMHAIRMARAYTGRNRVLKFEGAYHGFHDYTLWSCQPPDPGCGYKRNPLNIPHGSGIPQVLDSLVINIPFNDEEILERKVKEAWGDIACIIVEPLMGNLASAMPKDGYLQFVRKICDEYGIVLIMDEVKTGFRIA